MVWSRDPKLIFIHIPKCAGTTVEVALGLHRREDAGFGFA